MGAKVSENSDIPDDVKEAAENLELGASSGKIQTDISNDMAGDPPPWQKSRKGGPTPHHLPSNLPAGFLQTLRSAEDPTGLLWENFFRLRPSPPPSYHKNKNQQKRSKIRRTQKVVRPDNCSIPVEVTLSPGRTTLGQKNGNRKEIYRVPPYPTGKPETKILPSLRGCGGASLVRWGRRPSDQGKNLSATRLRSEPLCTFSLRGPLIRARRRSIQDTRPYFWDPFTPSHWNCASTTHYHYFIPPATVVFLQKTSLRKARVSSARW
ncbi:hypothetical protein GEV33_000695 [Tenebrio molitor]|uniref:Uncharacterized protein n=1 Tax=Tenebrio molitor TaxID=7067 RepID=A0A8J6LQU2_TENMO|nr:hypothetical protein GEV33_000695 [Tenebrio molitor]